MVAILAVLLVAQLIFGNLLGTSFPCECVCATSTGQIVYRGDTVLLTAHLEDENGNPVPNATIEFFDETNNVFLGSNITDTNGVAIFEWKIPLNYPLGETVINATFRGDVKRNLAPSVERVALEIHGHLSLYVKTYDTTGDPYDRNIAPGDKVYFIIKLEDENGLPLKGFLVNLLDNEGNVISSGFSNDSGLVCLDSGVITSTGEFTFHINVPSQNYFTNVSVIVKIRSDKIRTNILIEEHALTTYRGDNITICGILEDEYRKPLSNMPIYLEDRYGNDICYCMTDSSGAFCFCVNIPRRANIGLYVFTVTFPGTQRYRSASANVSIKVKGLSKMNVKNASFIVLTNDLTTIIVSLMDENGCPISSANVTAYNLNTSEVLSSGITDSYGVTTLTFVSPSSCGIYNISVMFCGNDFYNGTKEYVQLLVLERTMLQVAIDNNATYFLRGDLVTFSVKLMDSQGRPLANETLVVITSASTTDIMCNKTDNYGIARFRYKIPDSASMGQLIFKVVYEGNIERLLGGSETYFHVNIVEKLPTNISVEIMPLDDGDILLKIRLYILDGRPVSNANISIFAGNAFLYNLTTSDDGSAVFTIKKDDLNKYTRIRIIFYGSDILNDCSLEVDLTNFTHNISTTKSSEGLSINYIIYYARPVIISACCVAIVYTLKRLRRSELFRI